MTTMKKQIDTEVIVLKSRPCLGDLDSTSPLTPEDCEQHLNEAQLIFRDLQHWRGEATDSMQTA